MRTPLFLLTALACAAPADAAVFTVGYGGDCTHASIQAAIDAAAANGPGEDEVRVIATEYTLQRLLVANQSLVLTGGWGSCAADAAVVGATGLVGGFEAGTPGTNAVLRVQAGDSPIHTVTVRRFELRDGSGGADGNGGGIDAFGALRLVLGEVSITGNRVSGSGGGIFLRGPSGGNFGGILELDPGVTIHANRADFSGGGLQLERATARIRADRTAITGNQALYGGGIYSRASSISIGRGGGDPDPQSGATGHRIAGNRAQLGGGVYLENGSLFDAHELRLESNVASQNGGGLYAIGASQVQIQLDYPNAFRVECEGEACSRIAANQAGNGCPGSTASAAASTSTATRAATCARPRSSTTARSARRRSRPGDPCSISRACSSRAIACAGARARTTPGARRSAMPRASAAPHRSHDSPSSRSPAMSNCARTARRHRSSRCRSSRIPEPGPSA